MSRRSVLFFAALAALTLTPAATAQAEHTLTIEIQDLPGSIASNGTQVDVPFTVRSTGLVIPPGGRFSLRADVTDHLYQIQYPEAYVISSNGNPAVLTGSQGRGSWQHNAAITVGASYLFFR